MQRIRILRWPAHNNPAPYLRTTQCACMHEEFNISTLKRVRDHSEQLQLRWLKTNEKKICQGKKWGGHGCPSRYGSDALVRDPRKAMKQDAGVQCSNQDYWCPAQCTSTSLIHFDAYVVLALSTIGCMLMFSFCVCFTVHLLFHQQEVSSIMLKYALLYTYCFFWSTGSMLSYVPHQSE